MPEWLKTVWGILLVATGWGLAAVNMFERLRITKKLGLEITKLKEEIRQQQSRIHQPTPGEVEHFGRVLQMEKPSESMGLWVAAGVVILAAVAALFLAMPRRSISVEQFQAALAQAEANNRELQQSISANQEEQDKRTRELLERLQVISVERDINVRQLQEEINALRTDFVAQKTTGPKTKHQ